MTSTATGRRLTVAFIFCAVVGADQATKYLAVGHLTRANEYFQADTLAKRLGVFFGRRNLDGDPPSAATPDLRTDRVVVVPRFWALKYVENPGAAWGILSRRAAWFRVPFFHLVSIAAIALMGLYLRALPTGQGLLRVALSLVLGGAVGNYLDRLVRSYVIDFVDWHWYDDPRLHWPTFNVADSAIVVGVALMLGETLFVRRRVQPEQPSAQAAWPADGDGTSPETPGAGGR